MFVAPSDIAANFYGSKVAFSQAFSVFPKDNNAKWVSIKYLRDNYQNFVTLWEENEENFFKLAKETRRKQIPKGRNYLSGLKTHILDSTISLVRGLTDGEIKILKERQTFYGYGGCDELKIRIFGNYRPFINQIRSELKALKVGDNGTKNFVNDILSNNLSREQRQQIVSFFDVDTDKEKFELGVFMSLSPDDMSKYYRVADKSKAKKKVQELALTYKPQPVIRQTKVAQPSKKETREERRAVYERYCDLFYKFEEGNCTEQMGSATIYYKGHDSDFKVYMANGTCDEIRAFVWASQPCKEKITQLPTFVEGKYVVTGMKYEGSNKKKLFKNVQTQKTYEVTYKY